MANIGFKVKTEELPEAKGFELLPAGKGYVGMSVNAKLMPTNKTKEIIPDGVEYTDFLKDNPRANGYLNLEISVQGGEFAGRTLFHKFNLINDNEVAENIAWGQMKQFLEAVGIKEWSGEESELVNKRFSFDLAVTEGKPYEKDGKTYEGRAQNDVKKFYAVGATASAPSSTAAASTPAPQTKAGSAPWKK